MGQQTQATKVGMVETTHLTKWKDYTTKQRGSNPSLRARETLGFIIIGGFKHIVQSMRPTTHPLKGKGLRT